MDMALQKIAGFGQKSLVRGFHTSSCNSMMTTLRKNDIFNIKCKSDFEKLVLKSDKPVLIDFHARWCEPCKQLSPRLESALLAFENSVHLARVDIDINDDLAEEYKVCAVPVVFGIKDGKVTDKFIGLHKADRITSFVRKLLRA